MTLFDWLQFLWLHLTVLSVSGVTSLIIVIFMFDLIKENTYVLSSVNYFAWRSKVKAVLVWFTAVFLLMVVIAIFAVSTYWLIGGF